MDAVITYVDGNDSAWKQDYEKTTNVPVMEKRFRDWGTLKYLLRGIETKMPFIRNVYLVVSHTSQVPEWVDQEQFIIWNKFWRHLCFFKLSIYTLNRCINRFHKINKYLF